MADVVAGCKGPHYMCYIQSGRVRAWFRMPWAPHWHAVVCRLHEMAVHQQSGFAALTLVHGLRQKEDLCPEFSLTI